MSAAAHFDAKFFRFLKELAANNERAWFQDNKARFVDDVQGPMLSFIGDFAGRLRKVSPHFVADPRPSGGSMFRIYRDTRFSKNKTPYKIHAAAWFRHEIGKSVHAPGFYLHLEPGSVFAGAGLWHPDSSALQKIRDRITNDTSAWKRAAHGKAFRSRFTIGGDTLKRPPRGYDADHPMIEDLKRKDFVVSEHFTQKDACRPDFSDRVRDAYKAASPLVRFLTESLELPYR